LRRELKTKETDEVFMDKQSFETKHLIWRCAPPSLKGKANMCIIQSFSFLGVMLAS
jgi:hypothetical protein